MGCFSCGFEIRFHGLSVAPKGQASRRRSSLETPSLDEGRRLQGRGLHFAVSFNPDLGTSHPFTPSPGSALTLLTPLGHLPCFFLSDFYQAVSYKGLLRNGLCISSRGGRLFNLEVDQIPGAFGGRGRDKGLYGMACMGWWLLEGELLEEIYFFEPVLGGGAGINTIAFFSHFPSVRFIMLVWELGT